MRIRWCRNPGMPAGMSVSPLRLCWFCVGFEMFSKYSCKPMPEQAAQAIAAIEFDRSQRLKILERTQGYGQTWQTYLDLSGLVCRTFHIFSYGAICIRHAVPCACRIWTPNSKWRDWRCGHVATRDMCEGFDAAKLVGIAFQYLNLTSWSQNSHSEVESYINDVKWC